MSIKTETLKNGYEEIAKPALFAFKDPETAHKIAMLGIRTMCSTPMGRAVAEAAIYEMPTEPTTVAGIEFPGRVGLAAGMDKTGKCAKYWQIFGFGHAELGTITVDPRKGNPRQRMWRFPKAEAVVNYMGFNNPGVDAFATTLQKHGIKRGNLAAGIPIGISIGSVATDPEEANKEYQQLLEKLHPHADYFVANFSCPNVSHADDNHTSELIEAMVKKIRELSNKNSTEPTPLFWKISPDLSENELLRTLEITRDKQVAGIIACNTSVELRKQLAPDLPGGLSGRPLFKKSLEVVKFIRQRDERIPIIASGGGMEVDDFKRMFDKGANIAQALTGFIFHGPALIREINELKKIA